MNWILENWVTLLAVWGGVHTAASAITAATKTPKDDAALAKAYRAVEMVAFVVGKAKQAG